MSDTPVGWVVAVQSAGRHFLVTHGNEIMGFTSQKEALDYFEAGYERQHRRNAEASASAAIHWMFFSPVVVPIPNVDTMNEWLVKNERGKMCIHTLSSVAGRFCGVEIDPTKVQSILATGCAVSLMRV